MDFLTGTLRYLSERVGAQLRREEKLAGRVVLKLRYQDFHTISRHHTLPSPTHLDEDIFHAGLSLLKRALENRSAFVRLIGVGVTQLTPRASQLSLLDPRHGSDQDLALAMDAIREKFGFASIQRGTTLSLDRRFQTER
jgi:DNA polymerase-4